MLRINRILSAVLALLFSFCAFAEGDIISSEKIVSDIANYNTIEVQKGEYIKTQSAAASILFPNQYTVRYEGAAARFVEYNVKRDQEVKKGDLLMTLSVERDEVSLARMNMEIERAVEDYEAGKLSYEEQLLDKDRQISEATDAYSREIRRLEKEKLLIQYEKYRFETENSIQDRRDSLQKTLESYENSYVYAPADGIVSQLTYFRKNEYIYNGTTLMLIYDPSEYLLMVKDGGALRYNAEVSLAVGQNKNRVTGTGRVIASPNALPGSSGSAAAYIRVDTIDGIVKSLVSPNVTFTTQYLGNVYVINRKAITLYGGKNYVYKLSEDGMVSKRYVNFAFGNNATGAYILDGVTEGEKLILD